MEALIRGFAIQRRTISAIAMREVVIRWGRKDFGSMWLFLEPLVFAFPVIAVWTMVRAPFEHGLPMTAFCWTGYMPLLVFRHVTNGSLFSLRSNAAVLYHRQVTPFDIFVARQGTEALGNLGSVVCSFTVLLMLGFLDFPSDFGLVLLGFLYTTWWALSVALFLTAFSERSHLVLHIWMPMSYLYVFFSGFMFMADWLPVSMRKFMLAINPPLHCYEIIRNGMFGNIVPAHYDLPYLTFMLAILTIGGLWAMYHVRKHIEIE